MDIRRPREAAIAATDDFSSWIGALKRTVGSYFRDGAVRRHLSEELAALGDRDLDRVLAEIGCSRDELPILIANAPRSKPLLDAMILRLGLEKAFMKADLDLTRSIERRCGTCTMQRECRRWLNKQCADGGHERFCPNAGNFEALAGRA